MITYLRSQRVDLNTPYHSTDFLSHLGMDKL